MRKKTFEDAKQTYLNHSTDKEVIRKLTPSHIIGLKRVEIEERKLQLETNALKLAVLGKLMGSGNKVGTIVDGEINEINTSSQLGEGTR